jgi:hypothetical protein
MAGSKEARNKALVLKAFDTLFNFLSRRETKRSVQPFQPESESWSAKRRINESL